MPSTVTGIRTALPARLRVAFHSELDEAIDSGEITAVDAVKARWWARAAGVADPSIRGAYAVLDHAGADERDTGPDAVDDQ